MSLLDGVWRLIGAHDDELDDNNVMEYPQKPPAAEAGEHEKQDIISMPMPEKQAVYVVKPMRDAQGNAEYSLSAYVNFLKSHQTLVLDINELVKVDRDEAMRIVDYLAGAVRMAEGEAFEISEHIFIFTPHNITLAGDPLRRIEVV
ncbi:cell division protein SepF [bacterium]|nr:cell division protein SepF [bacterium]